MTRTNIAIFSAISIAMLLLLIFVPMFLNTRPLSEQERLILEPIFASSVNLDNIRIKSGGLLTLAYPGITLGNTIAFPKNGSTLKMKNTARS